MYSSLVCISLLFTHTALARGSMMLCSSCILTNSHLNSKRVELSSWPNAFEVFSLIYQHIANILPLPLWIYVLYSIIYGTAFSCVTHFTAETVWTGADLTNRFSSSLLSCLLFVHNSVNLPVGEVWCDVQEGDCNGAEGFLLHYTAAHCG